MYNPLLNIFWNLIRMSLNLIPLSQIEKNTPVIIRAIDESLLPHNVELETGELERRILEIGMIEGVELKINHFGLINRDPIAVEIGQNGLTIAIRRNEAEIILVEKLTK